MSQKFITKFLTYTALVAAVSFSPNQAFSADLSIPIEAGGTINVDGSNTFLVDGTNDGDAAAAIVFNDDVTNGVDSLTVSADGTDGDGTAQIGTLTALDDNGTNTFTINDATNSTDFTFYVDGAINGNVATDANDLNIIIDSTVTDAGNSILSLNGDVDLGTGSITLTGDANDTSQISFVNTGAGQTVTGAIISTIDDVGSAILITNGAQTVTFNDSVGSDGSGGLALITIGNGTANANATFAGTVDASVLFIDSDQGNSIADFDGDVTGGNIRLESGAANDATARFSQDVTVIDIRLDEETATPVVFFDGTTTQTITGTIFGASAGEGDVRFGLASDVIFNDAIGTTAIDSFAVDGTTTVTLMDNLTTQDDLNTNVGVFAASGTTLNLDTSSNSINITENTGDINLDGTISATGSNSVGITAASDLFIDGSVTTALSGASRTFTIAGTDSINLGTAANTSLVVGNQIVVNGDITLGGGAIANTLNIRKTSDFDPNTTALIDATGDIVTFGGGTLTIGIDGSSLDLSNGDTITIIDSDTNATTSYATLVTNEDIVFEGSLFFDLVDDGSDAQDLKVLVQTKDDIEGVSGTQETVIIQAVTAVTNDNEAKSALLGLSSTQTADASQQLISDETGGAATTKTIAANMSSGFDTVSARLSNLRHGVGRAQSGLSSGDEYTDKYFWVRGFGYLADQDERSSVQGYSADTVGMMFGADAMVYDMVRLGVNAGYSVTDVDGDGSGNPQTDIYAYRLGVYGGKEFKDYYVEGQISAAFNDIDTARQVSFGGLNRTASGDTYGYEYGARFGVGMPQTVGNGHQITPYADLQYIHSTVDEYTETGAGSLNSTVDTQDIDVLELALGAKYAAKIESSTGTFIPEIRAAVAYDFIGDTPVTNQTFTGGGSTFQIKGADAAQLSGNYGLGLGWDSSGGQWTFSVDYDGKVKSDYISHGARIESRFAF